MASLITRTLKVQPLRLAMSKSLGTALRSAILRGSAFHFKFNPPQQPLLSLPSRIQVARLHQVSNSSRNKKLESIFVRRLFHASRPLRQHHDQGPPPPLQINLKHVGAVAVLTLIAVGGLNYYMYCRQAAQQAAQLKALKSDLHPEALKSDLDKHMEQILEELKKVEQELQEKAHQQLSQHQDLEHQQHLQKRRVWIKKSNMSEDMQQDAVDCASQALEKYNSENYSDIATFIRTEFDKKYNPTWRVIIRKRDGLRGIYSITHPKETSNLNFFLNFFRPYMNSKHFIDLDLGQVVIWLFKSE